jgi:glycosyltransferase involved in cell wall biosynthesis
MREGTPVVAYANGGLAEYVADAGGGMVVPSDVDALVRACRELHGDRETWEAFSAQGLAAIAATHSRDAYVDSLERLYGEAVS